ncbi:hypothetical protein MNBD_GAMMA22-1190 [hydrothermal vent metagenome]|uniref:Lipoprotein n=1 Tax=hydrothermal vent metagenome TaxID=652676 RepID=A0A3B1AVZ9_9ZZZZ
MNFYKVTKTSILLVSGVLLACSPNEQQSSQTSGKNTTITAQENNQQTGNSFQGMIVHIDPASGKFLDTAPADYVAPKKVNNNNSLNVNSGQDSVYQEKQSTTPGGGTYMKMPKP